MSTNSAGGVHLRLSVGGWLIEVPAAAGGQASPVHEVRLKSKTEARRARTEALVEYRAGQVDVDRRITTGGTT